MKKIMKVSTALAAFVLVMNASFTGTASAKVNDVYLDTVAVKVYGKTIEKAANKEYKATGVKDEKGIKRSFSYILNNKGNVIMNSTLKSNTLSISNSSTTERDLTAELTRYDRKTKTTQTLGTSTIKNATRTGCGTGFKRDADNKNYRYEMWAQYKKPYSNNNNPGGDDCFHLAIQQW